MIEKLPEIRLADSLASVYDVETLTQQQAIARQQSKVNECVKVVNGVEESAIESQEIVEAMQAAQEALIDSLTNDVVPGAVSVKLDEMEADGSLAAVINNEIFGQLNEDIDAVEATLLNKQNLAADKTFAGGVTDATAHIQAALDAAAGKTLIIPAGVYKITSITIPANTALVGYGAKLINQATDTPMVVVNSGCKVIGLEIEGKGNTAYNANGKGISIDGGSVASYVENVVIKDCYVHEFAAIGIFYNFAKHVSIENCRVTDIVYAGCGGGCVEHVHISNCDIDNITPGTGGNAYGVYFSRNHVADTVASPRSSHCSVKNSRISNVAIWEGLDTHGGEYIDFVGNTIWGCATGILIGSSKDESSTAMLTPSHCCAINNTINGIGDGAGIILEGVAGSPGLNNKVVTNTIIDCGAQTNTTMGAIWLKNHLDNTIVKGNYLKDSISIGIAVNGQYLTNTVITENIIDEVKSNTSTSCPGIAVNGYYSSGIIQNNILKRTNDAADTYVSERGIYGRTGYGNSFMVANNINNFVTPYYSINHDNSSVELFGGANIKTGLNSPEGVVTASPGCLYINLNGGASTTLYVKQSGTGNTGWVGK